jgi:hypothetical protein
MVLGKQIYDRLKSDGPTISPVAIIVAATTVEEARVLLLACTLSIRKSLTNIEIVPVLYSTKQRAVEIRFPSPASVMNQNCFASIPQIKAFL